MSLDGSQHPAELAATPAPVDQRVTYTVDGEVCEVRLQDLKQLILDIEHYNSQFSMGNILARYIIGRVHFEHDQENAEDQSGETADDTEETQQITNEIEDQHTTAFFMSAAHRSLLQNTGLTLEPVTGRRSVILTAEAVSGDGLMRMNVHDAARFVAFLASLGENQVTESAIKSELGNIAGTLAQQVVESYNIADLRGDSLELFNGLEAIVSQYKRLGLHEAIQMLEVYLTRMKIGDLQEFIQVQRQRLLVEPGHFGPADWQKDISAQKLEERWVNAIATLDRCGENEHAVQLYTQLRKHLEKCVQIALEHLPTIKYLSQERKDEFRLILEVAQQKLQQLPWPKFAA